MKKLIALSLFTLVAFASCKKDTTNSTTATTTTNNSGPQLKFVFKFDSTQTRYNSAGQIVATPPVGHSAQCPKFNGMSAHYIEMTQNNVTAVGAGAILYTTPTTPVSPVTVWNSSHTTSQTYTDAINFNQETVVGDGQQFFSKPLSQITPGTYPFIRISVAYQNYDIKYGVLAGTTVNLPTGPYTYTSNIYSTGTIASFIGYNTQIGSYVIKTQTDVVNTDKQQGYWAFESAPIGTYTVPYSYGQAPQGATTVVSPAAFATTAIPPGSCLVTGQFVNQAGATQPLVITGHEISDITIIVSMSTNNSFEWIKHSSPNDNYIYPLSGDTVVDMGVRGMVPKLPQ